MHKQYSPNSRDHKKNCKDLLTGLQEQHSLMFHTVHLFSLFIQSSLLIQNRPPLQMLFQYYQTSLCSQVLYLCELYHIYAGILKLQRFILQSILFWPLQHEIICSSYNQTSPFPPYTPLPYSNSLHFQTNLQVILCSDANSFSRLLSPLSIDKFQLVSYLFS